MTYLKFRPTIVQIIFPVVFGLPCIALGVIWFKPNGSWFIYLPWVFALLAFSPLTIRKKFGFDNDRRQILSSIAWMGMEFFKTHLQITANSEFILKDKSASGQGTHKAVHLDFLASGRLIGHPEHEFDTYVIVSHHSDFNKTATLEAVQHLAETWGVPLKDSRNYG